MHFPGLCIDTGENAPACPSHACRHPACAVARPLRASDTADDQLIGTVGLNGVDPWHGRGELAYDLDPRWQGQGLATHAARGVLDWAHGTCGLVRIQATVLDSNARSIALLERLGMQREGRLRAYRHVRGQPRDFWMYAHVNGVVSPR
ncbi:GNAT family N-acetyltransferase [Stenotrophomonas sp. NRRL B-14846]|uniref:GNAT family N-acetyltransferase n=1 Tax=Stenotrophomonas sp. NRRL B-14846 TaxID=3162882 RepID=UPI003D2C203B